MKLHLLPLLVSLFFICCNAKKESLLRKANVIVCIGDSTTHGKKKGYVEFIQQYVNQNYPELDLTFLNWGRGAETITQLTEKQYEIEYKKKRPYLFDRLDKQLQKMQSTPDVAVFCYGINCGISGTPSEELFSKYKEGLQTFLDKMEHQGTKVILMTPPPFSLDVAKQNGWKRQASEHYSWRNPYEKYDEEVVQVFRDIVLNTKHPSVIKIIDIHKALSKKSSECYGKDPIHPNPKGYELMGKTFLQDVGLLN